MDDRERIKELTALLNEASRAYYAEDREIMPNIEYDRLYDELAALEQRTGIVLSDSPTVNVGYASVESLPKERHEEPMLSLGKTKDREELAAFLGDHEGLLSWKMDGLTVVLTYREGELAKAVTRGNGEIGEVVTPNARTFRNLPLSIPFKGELILRGEAVIRYSDFERINEELEQEAIEDGREEEIRYKNPRNLCSGSVRQLNSSVTAKRGVRLYVFTLVRAMEKSRDGDSYDVPADFGNSREKQFAFLKDQGFETVEYVRVNKDTVVDAVSFFEHRVADNDLPSDGLVLTLDDIAYGQSLGRTAKFPRDSIAFKWADELQETTLTGVEWSPSRTGLINPVALFDPVELEGTTVRRASVHNVSIVRALKLGIGDRIRVYKANMIIPQIAENLTGSDSLEIPESCPACGGRTEIRQVNDARVLICVNPSCPAKRLKSFELFCSRNAMNIEGLSEMTLEKFIGMGLIREYRDIYHLGDHREEIENLEGFGARSFANLEDSVNASRRTTLSRLLYAVGIPGIGVANARLICRYFSDDLEALMAADAETLASIEGIGPVLAGAVAEFFSDSGNKEMLGALLPELEIEKENMPGDRSELPLAGKTFVITGAVHHFENRDALKRRIEELGGKAAGSVSAKTSYLINNDNTSASSKNKKAKELGIPVITEDEFLEMSGD